MRACTALTLFALLAVVGPPAAVAQFSVGAGGGVGLVVGGASDLLNGGMSVGVSVARRFTPRPIISGRLIGTRHALERDRDAVSGNTASNTLVSVLAGPEVAVTVWRLEPFVFGGVGLATNAFAATSGGMATVDDRSTAFTWGVSGGLRVRMTGGAHPVDLEASGTVMVPGTLGFARVNLAPQRFSDEVAVLAVGGGVRLGL